MNKGIRLILLFLLLAILPLSAHAYEVKGVVKDSLYYEPIPYSSVIVQGTGEGAITNVVGRFTLEMDTAGWIVVSANGYNTVRTLVNSDDSITILLSPIIKEKSPLEKLASSNTKLGAIAYALEQYPVVRLLEKLYTIYNAQYIPLGGEKSKIELGSISSWFRSNHLEGVNLGIGFRTTTNLSKHWFGNATVYYGFKDRKIKYNTHLEYSFTPKEKYRYTFPVNALSISHDFDILKLGQEPFDMGVYDPTITLNLQSNNLILYKRNTQLKYTIENNAHVSMELSLDYNRYMQSYLLPFEMRDGRSIDHYSMSGIKLRLRYAPFEQVKDNKSCRTREKSNTPIFVLSHTWYPKHFLGSDYELNQTEFGIYNRVGILKKGYIEGFFNVGKIWNNKVPYPSLLYPSTNLSLFLCSNTFSLLDPMEFPMSEYCSLDLTLNTGGLLINKIPYLDNLSEVVSFRSIWGHLSNGNDPTKNRDLINIPNQVEWSHFDSDKPYMEFGVGIDNIFSLLRIDYVRRLSYRTHSNIFRYGFRLKLNLGL